MKFETFVRRAIITFIIGFIYGLINYIVRSC